MSYLHFVPSGASASGKTKLWTIQSLGGAILGRISWFGQWRKYTFWPHDSVFDANCLREIAEFLDEKMKEHKA